MSLTLLATDAHFFLRRPAGPPNPTPESSASSGGPGSSFGAPSGPAEDRRVRRLPPTDPRPGYDYLQICRRTARIETFHNCEPVALLGSGGQSVSLSKYKCDAFLGVVSLDRRSHYLLAVTKASSVAALVRGVLLSKLCNGKELLVRLQEGYTVSREGGTTSSGKNNNVIGKQMRRCIVPTRWNNTVICDVVPTSWDDERVAG